MDNMLTHLTTFWAIKSTQESILYYFSGSSEVYIYPKINISARILKMALHKNSGMYNSLKLIFLHKSSNIFAQTSKMHFFVHNLNKKLTESALYHILHMI